MRNPLSKTIVEIKPSGIRKYFDIVSDMNDPDVISLGVVIVFPVNCGAEVISAGLRACTLSYNIRLSFQGPGDRRGMRRAFSRSELSFALYFVLPCGLGLAPGWSGHCMSLRGFSPMSCSLHHPFRQVTVW